MDACRSNRRLPTRSIAAQRNLCTAPTTLQRRVLQAFYVKRVGDLRAQSAILLHEFRFLRQQPAREHTDVRASAGQQDQTCQFVCAPRARANRRAVLGCCGTGCASSDALLDDPFALAPSVSDVPIAIHAMTPTVDSAFSSAVSSAGAYLGATVLETSVFFGGVEARWWWVRGEHLGRLLRRWRAAQRRGFSGGG